MNKLGKYQIRRTLRRRGTGTVASQQISHWKADRWEPLTDTHLKKEFDKWVGQGFRLMLVNGY